MREGCCGAEQILREELRVDDLDTVFSWIDPKPIASASLAQVHRAQLKEDGRIVAVKVQHQGLQEMCQVDIRTISLLVSLVKWLFPSFEYTWLVREVEYNLPRELNFLLEGENADAARANFGKRPEIRIPDIVWDLSSPRLLVMSWEDGCYVDDIDAIKKQGLNPKVRSLRAIGTNAIHFEAECSDIERAKFDSLWAFCREAKPARRCL